MKTYSTLGEIVQKHGGLIQTGPFGSQLHESDYQENGVPVVMPTDINNGRIDESVKWHRILRQVYKQWTDLF